MDYWDLTLNWDEDFLVFFPTLVWEKIVFPGDRNQEITANTFGIFLFIFSLELSFYKES